MKRVNVFALLLFAFPVFAQTPPVPGGSTVYIEPMQDYENYLMAAFAQKHVPLVIVTEKEKADFIIRTKINHLQPSQPAVVINNSNTGTSRSNDAWNQGWQSGQQGAARRAALGSSTSNLSVVDPRSSMIVFSYTCSKGGDNQIQKAAENCAKHLKEFIEKSEKPKR